jgi:hypothetical protein
MSNEDIINVELSPEIIDYDFDLRDSLIASLLCWQDRFYDVLKDARDLLEISNKKLNFPKEPTLDNLYDLAYSLGSDKSSLIKIQSLEIIKEFGLTPIWDLSMRIVILTNTLMIPPKSDSIRLEGAGYKLNYPAIYITSYTSVDELKKWIHNNRLFIRLMIKQHFPKKRTSPRLDDKTLFWGQIATLFKERGLNSWVKMVEIMQRLQNKDLYSSRIPEEIPNPGELRTYYNRFNKSVALLGAKGDFKENSVQ